MFISDHKTSFMLNQAWFCVVLCLRFRLVRCLCCQSQEQRNKIIPDHQWQVQTCIWSKDGSWQPCCLRCCRLPNLQHVSGRWQMPSVQNWSVQRNCVPLCLCVWGRLNYPVIMLTLACFQLQWNKCCLSKALLTWPQTPLEASTLPPMIATPFL